MVRLTANVCTIKQQARCTVEERDLCFVCYRNEHIEGEERLWHDWETSKAYTCRICVQRDATVVCPDCADKGHSQDTNRRERAGGHGKGEVPGGGGGGDNGGLVLCDTCWERTHAHADVQHHKEISIDQWAARVRVMEGVAVAGGDQGGWLKGRGEVADEAQEEEQQVALVESADSDWDGSGGAYDFDYDGSVAAFEYAGAAQYGHEPYYES